MESAPKMPHVAPSGLNGWCCPVLLIRAFQAHFRSGLSGSPPGQTTFPSSVEMNIRPATAAMPSQTGAGRSWRERILPSSADTTSSLPPEPAQPAVDGRRRVDPIVRLVVVERRDFIGQQVPVAHAPADLRDPREIVLPPTHFSGGQIEGDRRILLAPLAVALNEVDGTVTGRSGPARRAIRDRRRQFARTIRRGFPTFPQSRLPPHDPNYGKRRFRRECSDRERERRDARRWCGTSATPGKVGESQDIPPL